MTKRDFHINIPSREHQVAWEQDIAALQNELAIGTVSQTVRTVIHLAAKLAHKMIVAGDPTSIYRMKTGSGEQAYIYPGVADTWTLQIGPDPMNSVERLASLDAAVALATKAN